MISCQPTPVCGKVLRVESATHLLVALDLAWGVNLRRIIKIAGFETEGLSSTEIAAAKHCLIVLAGGKPLWIHPLAMDESGVVEAYAYTMQTVQGSPVGWTLGLVDGNQSGLEIGPYLTSLRSDNFDVQRVRDDLNGIS